MKQVTKESKGEGKRHILMLGSSVGDLGEPTSANATLVGPDVQALELYAAGALAYAREGLPAAVLCSGCGKWTRLAVGHVANDLHDPKSGKLDARRIAEYLQVSLASIASAAGQEAALVRRSPAADSIQEGLAPVARTVAILAQFLGSRQQVRVWLHSPRPDLGGQSPMSLIQAGKPEAVADMLDAALAGQPL